ncbi:MAG TPA: hypothetical protein VF744_10405 [Beijerinckiaceae bacterium]|jgi:hypothetical protein
MKLVLAIALAAAACIAVEREAQAHFFPGAVATATLVDAAACHKRRVVQGSVKRITVPCGRWRVKAD